MFWSETHQETLLLGMDILGMRGQTLLGQVGQETPLPGARRAAANYPVNNLQSLFFFSRSESIWGGAAEIQRNIVGERVLGLPKEPRPSSSSPRDEGRPRSARDVASHPVDLGHDVRPAARSAAPAGRV